MPIRQVLQARLMAALTQCGVEAGRVVIEHPADITHGDYATGAALQYAKQAGIAPRALAEKLVAALGDIDGVSKIDIAGPGFINFHLAPAALAASIEEARKEDMPVLQSLGDGGWGANKNLAGKKILIEYTSPNLFKPLHIGNLVGNVIGESLARLMQFSSADVQRINYPSDIGLTVAKGVWGLTKAGGDPTDIAALGEAYRMGNDAYESDATAKEEIETINRKLYDGSDPELNSLRKRGVETSRTHLDVLCKKLGTTFDFELYESEAAPVGHDIVLSHPDIFPESDGARVFHGSHTRVFLNSQGLPTYEAKDLGNFVLKQEKYPEWDTYLVVTGVEQKEYFKVLYEAIGAVFPETKKKELRHVANGFLTLTTGKMSSRLGNVLTGESLFADLAESAKARATESRADDAELLAEQIGVAAIKYEVLKQGTGKNIVFDRERALSLEGDSGPYLQYAHARANAILEKAKESGVVGTVGTEAVPNEVARLLPRFPEVVERAMAEYEPHLVTTYLLELAGAFNSWYGREQILDGTPAAAHKVALTDAVRRTLKNGLWILGIPAPEKM